LRFGLGLVFVWFVFGSWGLAVGEWVKWLLCCYDVAVIVFVVIGLIPDGCCCRYSVLCVFLLVVVCLFFFCGFCCLWYGWFYEVLVGWLRG